MGIPLRKRAQRIGATLAAGLAVGLVGAPAYAADPAYASIQLGDQGYDYRIGAGGAPGKAFPVYYSGSNLVKPTVTFDFADIASFAAADADDADAVGAKCAVQGTKVVCDVADVQEWSVLPLHIEPKASAKNGQKGTITATVTAENLQQPVSATKAVTVASGVDLVATEWHLDDPGNNVKPGDELKTPVAVANAGNLTAKGVQLTFRLGHGLIPAQYANCTYAEDRYATTVVCDLDETIEPNIELILEPFRSKVAADGYGNVTVAYLAEADDVASDLPQALAAKAKKGAGSTIFGANATKKARPNATANAKPADVDDRDNFGGTDYDIKNALDLAALGAQASGAAGSTVKVKVGAKNNGPASGNTNRSGGEPFVILELRLPEGTELASVPENCGVDSESAAKVQCYSPDTLYVGESYLVELPLKINKVTPNAAGLVTFFHHDSDPDKTNDSADIVLNPANGTGGNPGGGNNGGSLPVTGVQVGLIAGAGAVLLAGGIFFYTVARRRRVLLVTPKE